ncbi:DNA polymerase III subunit delta [Robertkochia aurantiaca]|uniref:DNA polymerase III subunit delta n=1 Tax=Robertkochia aurantiaca TaxID=2873700 RepID=UPI001CCE396F|nr:DNA polymerase III subunit delta [Robertkochia sp. 3YJGBD-33]
MDQVKKIVSDIKKGQISPVYFLFGEEPYYIDRISDFIEDNVLSEEEKGFNQVILYGKEVTVDDIVANAKRYPMMAERQVVIVKEAQHLARSIEKLEPYINDPQPTTVLVFCYKHKKPDGRLKVFKTLKKKGVYFESKKLYENQVADWIRKVLAGNDYSITPKAAQMLVEFLGTDLSKVHNELEKLKVVLPKGSNITPEVIEQNIGISKDYNNFELRNAIGGRDFKKAIQIVTYFSQNPKDNPVVVTLALLFSYFSTLMQYHALDDHSNKHVASVLKIPPYFVKDYQQAAHNYPMKKVSRVINYIREADMKFKGVGAHRISQEDLLKELMVKIMA